MGIFKGEIGERYELTQVASTTDSGIEIIKWIVLLMSYLGKKGTKKVSMLQDEEGKPSKISEIDGIFNEVLE